METKSRLMKRMTKVWGDLLQNTCLNFTLKSELISGPFDCKDVMDFFNWVSTGDNYKSSFQSSWGANAKRRRRVQAEAQRAQMEQQARAAAAAKAEAAEAAAAAAKARRGSGGMDPASFSTSSRAGRTASNRSASTTAGPRGSTASGKSPRKTIDGFAPVGRSVQQTLKYGTAHLLNLSSVF